jgi:hypothetical protein
MKKVLYGTTALMTAALAAGQSDAASGLKLGITGYYRGAAGATIGGDSVATSGGRMSTSKASSVMSASVKTTAC